VAVDVEHKLGDAAERLSDSAFLARSGSFRYIETRSGMKMSDKRPPFASGLLKAFFGNGVRQQDSNPAPAHAFSNRELTMRQASASRASNATRGIRFALSNRERQLLEPVLTHRKQTMASRSNRELSTNRCSCNFHLSGALLSKGLLRQIQFLTGSAPQTEFDVTYRKQTTAQFLTGSRIARLETRICAKMSAQFSSKLSTQMTGIR
jgi:hypothetical protein